MTKQIDKNSVCEWCGSKLDLCIHHNKNRKQEFIICRRCHFKFHQQHYSERNYWKKQYLKKQKLREIS